MSRRNTIAVWLGVAAAATLLASLAVGGAGASPTSSLALPRTQTLYVSGTRGGRTRTSTPSGAAMRRASSGCSTRRCSATTRSRTSSSPGSPRSAPGRGTRTSSRCATGVTWNDGKPMTAADVKFTFETGKLAGSQYSTMWKTGLQRVIAAGKHRPLRLPWHPELPGVGLADVLDSHRPAAHLVGLQREGHRQRQHRRHEEDGRHGAVQVRSRQGQLPDAPVEPA